MSWSWAILVVNLLLLVQNGESRCSMVEIGENWPGGYKAKFSTPADEDVTGVTITMFFGSAVASIDVYDDFEITDHSSKEYTFVNDQLHVSSGNDIVMNMLVSYGDPRPFVTGVRVNGKDVCGTGGETTAFPETPNPCDETDTLPYDYKQALCMSYLFYEAQRSGKLPDDQRVNWRQDSALDDGMDVGLDLSGGYYDAGDHVKFGFPMAFTAAVLGWVVIEYEQGLEAAGQLEYSRAAVKWATDYFLKAHSGHFELYGQIGLGQPDHNFWGRPEDMTMPRPSAMINVTAPGTELASDTASALAAASIIYKDLDPDYSAECLRVARELFEFADEYRKMYHESITDAANFYKSFNGFNDELTWSASWMAKATGEQPYLDKAKEYFDEFLLAWGAQGFGWDDKKPGIYVILSELDKGDLYTSTLQGWLEHMRTEMPYTPGGLLFLGQWGSIRSACGVAFIALRAADLGIDTELNREFAQSQIDFALGSTGRSFVVGFGVNPPTQPHHRSSSCPNPPESCTDGWAFDQPGPNPHTLYGALVGGPGSDGSYIDDRGDYVHNEVACDYNAAFTGVLAAIIQLQL